MLQTVSMEWFVTDTVLPIRLLPFLVLITKRHVVKVLLEGSSLSVSEEIHPSLYKWKFC